MKGKEQLDPKRYEAADQGVGKEGVHVDLYETSHRDLADSDGRKAWLNREHGFAVENWHFLKFEARQQAHNRCTGIENTRDVGSEQKEQPDRGANFKEHHWIQFRRAFALLNEAVSIGPLSDERDGGLLQRKSTETAKLACNSLPWRKNHVKQATSVRSRQEQQIKWQIAVKAAF